MQGIQKLTLTFIQNENQFFAGDVILREEPYAAVLESIFRVNHCAHCLRKTPTPIPCYECATVSTYKELIYFHKFVQEHNIHAYIF